MNKQEKLAIKELPPKYRPMGAWGYMLYSILWMIPVIGWISWIVCGVASKNISRRSYARSWFLFIFIAALLVGVYFLVDQVLVPNVITENVNAIVEQVKQILSNMGINL
jgi:cytochrome bd-type quinol oxidase subunit 2